MEASVDLSSPKKRPAYRPMWEAACVENDVLEAKVEAITVTRSRWATAAVIEAVTLVAVALILWLR